LNAKHKYAHRSVPLTTLPVGPGGIVIESKCDTCRTLDCGHRVEFVKVSVIGITKRMRCLISAGQPNMVIQCNGHT
jgi:hypothetical protein